MNIRRKGPIQAQHVEDSTPLKMVCSGCDYETEDPSEMLAHMMTCPDMMSPELKFQLIEGEGFAAVVRMLEQIQKDPEGAGTAVDPEDMPEEARKQLEAASERLRKKNESGS